MSAPERGQTGSKAKASAAAWATAAEDESTRFIQQLIVRYFLAF